MVMGHTKAIEIQKIHLADPVQISRKSEDRELGGRWEVGLRAAAALRRGWCLGSTRADSEGSEIMVYLGSNFLRFKSAKKKKKEKEPRRLL